MEDNMKAMYSTVKLVINLPARLDLLTLGECNARKTKSVAIVYSSKKCKLEPF
jgi:hypothetical protein